MADEALKILGPQGLCAPSLTPLFPAPRSEADEIHRLNGAWRLLSATKVRQTTSSDFLDELYEPEIRALSAVHWTPADVAIAMADLLVVDDQSVVLDIGSGVGKFCLLGALTTKGTFVGIEQRPHLAATARALAESLSLERALFLTGNALDLDWHSYTAFYLFNPFGENIETTNAIDRTVELKETLFDQYVGGVQENFARCRVGTRVGILNGFGGEMPKSYRRLGRRFVNECFAELWLKVKA